MQQRPIPQIPQLGQVRQQITSGPMPGPLPMMPTMPMQQPSELQDLAMEIYARLAVQYIRDQGSNPIDLTALRALAQSAQLAAMAFAEQLGVQHG